jgi:hypothetical protein
LRVRGVISSLKGVERRKRRGEKIVKVGGEVGMRGKEEKVEEVNREREEGEYIRGRERDVNEGLVRRKKRSKVKREEL